MKFTYNKFMWRVMGSYRILEVRRNTFAINQDGIMKMFLIYLVVCVARRNDEADDSRTEFARRNYFLDTKTHSTRQILYIVNGLVFQAYRKNGIQHRVRWYGYIVADDTGESLETIPKHLIDRYCKSKKQKLDSVPESIINSGSDEKFKK